MENRSRLPIFILIGVLVILLMIPISAILINPMESDPLNTPIFELGDMSLNEMFGTAQLDTEFNVLNNNTLNDIFDSGNIIDTETGSTYYDKTETTTYIRYTLTRDTQTLEVQNISTTENVNYLDDLYVRLKLKAYVLDTPFMISYQLDGAISGTNQSIISQSGAVSNTYYTYNNIYTLNINDFVGDTIIKFYLNDITHLNIGDYIEIDKTNGYLIVNRTSLGIDDLTVDEMNLIFEYWQDYLTFDTDLYMFLYAGLSLTADQWQYYYNLYTYYSSL